MTTVAAAFAMGQYFGIATDSFSAANTTQSLLGITNAESNSFRLADYTQGCGDHRANTYGCG